jgi:hypothetical protein
MACFTAVRSSGDVVAVVAMANGGPGRDDIGACATGGGSRTFAGASATGISRDAGVIDGGLE